MITSFFETLVDYGLSKIIPHVKRKNRIGVPTFLLVTPISEILDTYVLSKMVPYMKRRDILSLMCTSKYFNRVIPGLDPHFTIYASLSTYRINLRGEYDGEYKSYYDGKGFSRHIWCHYKNNKLEEKCITYYEEGGVHYLAEYKGGLLHGRRIEYDRRGEVIEILSCREGKARPIVRKPKKPEKIMVEYRLV